MTQIILHTSIDLDSLLENDPHLVSTHTTSQYRYNLQHFNNWRHDQPVTKTLVEAYAAAMLRSGLSPRTINQSLASIRWYARKILDLANETPGTDPEFIKQVARVALVEDLRVPDDETGRHIPEGEIAALLRVCKEDKNRNAGTRDAALIALAYATGIRRDIFTKADMTDFRPSPENEKGYDFTYTGKGLVKNTAYITGGALTYLRDWMNLRGTDPGPMFCNVLKNGKLLPGTRLTGEALRLILEKRSLQAGLAEPITWHDFRRTFGGNLWESGIDGATIQKLMSHKTQNQTAKYDRRPTTKRRRAASAIHVPYFK